MQVDHAILCNLQQELPSQQRQRARASSRRVAGGGEGLGKHAFGLQDAATLRQPVQRGCMRRPGCRARSGPMVLLALPRKEGPVKAGERRAATEVYGIRPCNV